MSASEKSGMPQRFRTPESVQLASGAQFVQACSSPQQPTKSQALHERAKG